MGWASPPRQWMAWQRLSNLHFLSYVTLPTFIRMEGAAGISFGDNRQTGSRRRLVAVCHVHAVTHLLTFNVTDFIRMAGFGPGVVVVDPAKV